MTNEGLMRIRKLERYGDRGWQWHIAEATAWGEIYTGAYRTNRDGEGLWRCGSYEGQWAHNYEDKQVAGTSQFNLQTDNYDAAYSRVHRYFTKLLGE